MCQYRDLGPGILYGLRDNGRLVEREPAKGIADRQASGGQSERGGIFLSCQESARIRTRHLPGLGAAKCAARSPPCAADPSRTPPCAARCGPCHGPVQACRTSVGSVPARGGEQGPTRRARHRSARDLPARASRHPAEPLTGFLLSPKRGMRVTETVKHVPIWPSPCVPTRPCFKASERHESTPGLLLNVLEHPRTILISKVIGRRQKGANVTCGDSEVVCGHTFGKDVVFWSTVR